MYSTTCIYEKTCPSKTEGCRETQMTEIHAKPIVDGKFWIVEEAGEKIATIQAVEEGGFVYVHDEARELFPSIKILQKTYNIEFVKAEKPKRVNKTASYTLRAQYRYIQRLKEKDIDEYRAYCRSNLKRSREKKKQQSKKEKAERKQEEEFVHRFLW